MRQRASIVIRCYNEGRHIGRLLDGIVRQTVQDVEIIAVDSGSTDRTLSILSRYPATVLTILPQDFSFGRSLNMGCQVATGEFIVVVSAHVYPVSEHWLEELLTPFADGRVALVYGKQTGNEVTKYSERQVFAQWFPSKSNPDQEDAFCNNANAAVRRLVWDQLRYNEHLTGLEDIDWARRAMGLGYRIAYNADAAAVHVHEESWATICNRYRREAIALKRMYPHERFSAWDFARLFVANSVTDCYRAWREGALRRHLKSNLIFRFTQFWGTYRGFKSRGAVTSQLKRRLYYPGEAHSSGCSGRLAKAFGEIEYGSPPPSRGTASSVVEYATASSTNAVSRSTGQPTMNQES